MVQNAKHNRHCVYVINYHLVWIPRYRKRILVGVVARQLKAIFDEIAAQYRFLAIRHQYWGKNATLWAEGYYVGTAGHVSAETIKRYIQECQTS